MPKDTPRADDDLETAEAKSGTIDERVPEMRRTAVADETLAVGAPAGFMPHTGGGAGITSAAGEDLGPGEAVLEQEAKAQKSKIQRG